MITESQRRAQAKYRDKNRTKIQTQHKEYRDTNRGDEPRKLLSVEELKERHYRRQQKYQQNRLEKWGSVNDPTQKWRYTQKYVDWRYAVYERDNYICQSCKRKVCPPHAHHIKDAIGYPELRFDVDNGITLCESCHHQTHRTHRTRN